MTTRLRPHCPAMHAEPPCNIGDAESVFQGCSHSVHFLVREPCSGSFLWFYRRADQRVVRFPGEVAVVADALIPCGNEPLDPWSPVPAAFHCVHQSVVVQTNDVGETARSAGADGRPGCCASATSSLCHVERLPGQSPTKVLIQLTGAPGVHVPLPHRTTNPCVMSKVECF